MGKIVIVCYVPFAGNEDRLEALVRDHLDVLRQENLVTERKPVIARAKKQFDRGNF
jgi:hypothetical protein